MIKVVARPRAGNKKAGRSIDPWHPAINKRSKRRWREIAEIVSALITSRSRAACEAADKSPRPVKPARARTDVISETCNQMQIYGATKRRINLPLPAPYHEIIACFFNWNEDA